MSERTLVASDLHLNIGVDPTTGNYDRRENFFADESFRDWLGHYEKLGANDPGSRQTLVIAGDAFDFVRIDVYPESHEEYERWAAVLEALGEHGRAEQISRLGKWPPDERRRQPDAVVSRREEAFGLGTPDYKAVWKLTQIVGGHGPVFDALASWVGAGGSIVIVTGNHDLELHWPLVQKAIRWELATRATLDMALVEERVTFEMSYRSDNVYVEHGHRWEAMTAVHTRTAWLPHAPDQISLPLGSFMNRYLINGIERLDPFLDNVKPVGGALRALLQRYPFEVFRLYFRGWRFLGRAFRVKGFFNSIGAAGQVAALVLVPPTALAVLALFLIGRFMPAAWVGVLPAVVVGVIEWFAALPVWFLGLSIFGVSLPTIAPVLLPVLRAIGQLLGFGGKDHLLEGARKISRHLYGETPADRSYVVMGHTHWQEVRRLGHNRLYMNAGTWVPIWRSDRRDMAGRVFYNFLDFTRSDPRQPWHGQAYRWIGETREPERSRLLSAIDDRPLAEPTVRESRDRHRHASPRAALGILFALVVSAGCGGMGRSLSRGASEGVYERRDTLAAAVAPVVESGAGGLGRTFRDSIRPELVDAVDELSRGVRDSLTDAIMDSVSARLDRLDDSVAAFISGPANEALQELVTANLAATRASIDESLEIWVATLAASTEARLADALATATSNALGAAADSLAARMGSGRGLRESIVSLGDSVVTQAIAAIDRETGSRGLPWWVWAIIVAIALVVVAVVGRFILELRRRNRRTEDSLRIVGRAIKAERANAVADRVSEIAQEQGVGGWLHDFLADQHLLLEDER
ncbi:MAG: hypothetical protein R3195_03720 [Gemmatimonadota bacterium]|nr:hypothetical protein [Gemmatimonadota bacterium]